MPQSPPRWRISPTASRCCPTGCCSTPTTAKPPSLPCTNAVSRRLPFSYAEQRSRTSSSASPAAPWSTDDHRRALGFSGSPHDAGPPGRQVVDHVPTHVEGLGGLLLPRALALHRGDGGASRRLHQRWSRRRLVVLRLRRARSARSQRDDDRCPRGHVAGD